MLHKYSNEELISELLKRHGRDHYMCWEAVIPIGKDYSATLSLTRSSAIQLRRELNNQFKNTSKRGKNSERNGDSGC